MKKLYIFLLLFCTVLATYAKHDVAYICQGDTYSWNLSSYCTPDDTLIYASGPTDWNEFWQNTQYDTIIGNTIFLSPMADRVYKLISINGSDAMIDICPIYLTIYVRYAPTVSIDSIHHVTCPDGYLYPYADGSFHVNLDDSVENYIWIGVESDSSFFFTQTYYNSFTITDLRAGTYHIFTRGNNGCEYHDSVDIIQPAPWYIDWDNLYIDTLRCGIETGCIELSYSGGTEPLHYQWFYFDCNGDTIFFSSDTNRVCGLSAGMYCTYIHDSRGCQFFGDEVWGAYTYIYEIVVDTIHIIPIDTIVCPGEEVMLSAYSRGFGNHTWSVGEYSDSINYYTGVYPGLGYVSDYFIDTLTQSQYIKVTFSDENGCETSDSIWVDVSHIEVVSNIPDYMCSDALYPVNLSSYTYGSPQGGSLSFEGQGVSWNGDFSPASSGLYTIYTNYTDLMGCIARDSTIVNVLDPDPIVLIIDTMICYGDIPTIQAQTLNYGSYVWHIGNVLDSVNYSLDIQGGSVVATYQSTNMTQPTLISLDFANQHGCVTHDSVWVEVSHPVVDLSGTPNHLCSNGDYPLDVSDYTSTNPSGGVLYYYGPGMTWNGMFAPSSAGEYEIHSIYTDTYGCLAYDSIIVNVANPEPIILEVDTMMFTDSLYYILAPSGGTMLLGETALTETSEGFLVDASQYEPGYYTLHYEVLMGEYNCLSEFETVIHFIHRTNVREFNYEISIYPNPATTVLNLSSTEEMDFTISITDIAGKTIREERILSIQHALDVSGLSPGIYLLRMQTSSGASKSVKFVKR